MMVAEHMAAWDATHLSFNQPCTASACSAPGKRRRGSDGEARPSSEPNAEPVPARACPPVKGLKCTYTAPWLALLLHRHKPV